MARAAEINSRWREGWERIKATGIEWLAVIISCASLLLNSLFSITAVIVACVALYIAHQKNEEYEALEARMQLTETWAASVKEALAKHEVKVEE